MKASITAPPSVAGAGSRFAACAAAWCGVHCALTPVLVAAMPALALSEGVERGVFAATVALGALMLALGPARAHVSIMLTFAAGAVLWAASLAGLFEPLPESLTSAVGSLLLAWALFRSVRVCQAEACAVCTESESKGQVL